MKTVKGGEFWKELSQNVCDQHNYKGTGLWALPLGRRAVPPPGKVLMNVCGEPEIVKGTELHPRMVRTFLWNNRKSRFVTNEGVLWTAVADGQTAIGLAIWASPQVAAKMSESQTQSRFITLEV